MPSEGAVNLRGNRLNSLPGAGKSFRGGSGLPGRSFIGTLVTSGQGLCSVVLYDRDVPHEPDSPPPPGQTGEASWYGERHHGRLTASGEAYDMYELTAAHPSLPMGSKVLVTNLKNGKSVEVRINDRGPHVDGRIIDLSYAAAKQLGAVSSGTIPVRLQVISTPPP